MACYSLWRFEEGKIPHVWTFENYKAFIARPTSKVFQDYALFPYMNVAGNIAFGLEMQGLGRTERFSRVSDVLIMVGLAGFERRPVAELSSGQR